MKAIIKTDTTITQISFVKVIAVDNGIVFYGDDGGRVHKLYLKNMAESKSIKNYIMHEIISSGESKTIYIDIDSIL